jgi:hypothetical protein
MIAIDQIIGKILIIFIIQNFVNPYCRALEIRLAVLNIDTVIGFC